MPPEKAGFKPLNKLKTWTIKILRGLLKLDLSMDDMLHIIIYGGAVYFFLTSILLPVFGMENPFEPRNQTSPETQCQQKYNNSLYIDYDCYNYTQLQNQVIGYMAVNGAASAGTLDGYISMNGTYERQELLKRMKDEKKLVEVPIQEGDYYYPNRQKYEVRPLNLYSSGEAAE